MITEDSFEFQEVPEDKKLTDWKKEPSVRSLQEDLIGASRSHEDHKNKVELWLDNLNITGTAKRTFQKNRSSIVPRLIRKQAEWRYAALCEPFLSTDDVFEASPQTFEDKSSAEQAGLVLNHQFNAKIDKVRFVDEYIRTAVDEGTVITRVGWEYRDEIQEVEVPDFELVPVADPEQYQAMLQQGLEPVEEIQVGSHMEEQTVVLANHPTIEVCDYKSIIIDPTCEGDVSRANFIIYKFQTSIAQLEKAGNYINLDEINTDSIEGYTLEDEDDRIRDTNNFTFKDRPRKKLTAFEYHGYWDINDTGILEPIKVTFVGNVIIQIDESPYPDKEFPFVVVQYLPVRKSLYGEPDGALLEENQKIIGAVTRVMIDILGRSANGQTGMAKGALDLINKRKFDKGEDYEFNPNVAPDRIFYTHTFQDIPQSAQYMLDLQNREAEALTGVKAFHMGMTGEALGTTATAVRSALDATSKRELGILRRLAQGLIAIGRKMMAMNREFMSEEEVVRITNEEFVTIRRDDLAGHYDIRLTISTAESDNHKAERLAFMLQTMGNNMDPGLSRMILADIAKLHKMPTLAKGILDYQPQPDPYQERMKELQMAMLEAQVMNEQAKGRENATDVGLKEAKTQTELAKGRHLNSQSDLKDLDFLKVDSGQKQAEEMAMENEKFKQQLDLKAADTLLAAGSNLNKSPGGRI